MPVYDVGRVRPVYMGDYDPIKSYEVLMRVKHEGAIYESVWDVPSGAYPDHEDSIYWVLLSAPGSPGPKGDTGAKGDPGIKGDPGEKMPISDSVTNPESGIAASAKAVKTAYDKGTEALSAAHTAQLSADSAYSLAGFAQGGAVNAQLRADAAYGLAESSIADGVIPRGVIVMWTGTIGGIPTGWALCDGGNSTPDLRGRFVRGAGGNLASGQTGGSDKFSPSVIIEGTALTAAQMPSHTHSAGTTASAKAGTYGDDYYTTVGAAGSATSGSAGSGQQHTHGVTPVATECLPSFYVLAYIMKL